MTEESGGMEGLGRPLVIEEPSTVTADIVGARVAEDLRYLYESDTNFNVLPTFVVVPGLLANTINDWPGE
uniref:Peroxisomal multifunctional enzyme type 2-like N-terminal domain-containing protein n=1 Tax=Parascaris equorum TaxID=6256 RepID=A0A914RKX8_PAREQ